MSEVKLSEFKMTKRRGIIVWVYSLRQLKQLRRFGAVMYVSNRMKYVIIYMDEANVAESLEKISKLHFVRNVEISYRPDLEVNVSEEFEHTAAFQPNEDDGFEVEELNTTIKLSENI